MAGTAATSQMPSGAGLGAVARGTTTPRAKVRRGAQGRPPDPDSRGRGARGAKPLQLGAPAAQTLVPLQATSCSWTPRTPPPGAPLPTCSPSPRRPQPLRSVSPSGSTSTVPRSVRPPAGQGLRGASQGPRVLPLAPWGAWEGLKGRGQGLVPSQPPASRDSAPGDEARRGGRNALVVPVWHPRQSLARGLGHPPPPAGRGQVPGEAPGAGAVGEARPQPLTPVCPPAAV